MNTHTVRAHIIWAMSRNYYENRDGTTFSTTPTSGTKLKALSELADNMGFSAEELRKEARGVRMMTTDQIKAWCDDRGLDPAELGW